MSNHQESLLPEPIPVEFFSESFYGYVALKYWRDQSLVILSDAVVPVAKSFKPEQLLAIADLVLEDTIPDIENRLGVTLNMWDSPRGITLDKNNRVVADIGTPDNVLSYLMRVEKDYGGYDYSILEEAVYDATLGFTKDIDYANQLMDKLEQEERRRFNNKASILRLL